MTSDSTPALDVRDLWVAYPGAREPALRGITISVPRGALVAVVGPNGGGKSTLLKAALGLVHPQRGSLRLLGQDLRSVRARIGYVPQTELVDWRFPVTVLDVALMGTYGSLGLLRRPGATQTSATYDALRRVGIVDLASRQIGELSGGQQQRAFIARALVARPEMLIMDEPMSGVDAVTERDIFALLDRLRDEGMTVIMTTHDLTDVASRFDLVLFLNRTVVAYGPAEQVFTKEHLNGTYGSHLSLVKVGEHYVAVEDPEHHERHDPEHMREQSRRGHS